LLSRRPIRRRRGLEPAVIPDRGVSRMKEVTMTRRVSLWITAVLSIAATARKIGLTVAAEPGPSPADVPLAGIAFNAID
jgi:hypothetical protein